MFDFGLKPCPLCGGEAEVARLTQGPEECTGVIKCTACGLTLEWETEIKVVISRTGKRTRVKAGLDPIEAWNRREGMEASTDNCQNCSYLLHVKEVAELPSCNDCGLYDCKYRPDLGKMCRINCPLWRPMEERNEKEATDNG